jgi:hypothetical protein
MHNRSSKTKPIKKTKTMTGQELYEKARWRNEVETEVNSIIESLREGPKTGHELFGKYRNSFARQKAVQNGLLKTGLTSYSNSTKKWSIKKDD